MAPFKFEATRKKLIVSLLLRHDVDLQYVVALFKRIADGSATETMEVRNE